VLEGRPNIVDAMKNGEVQLVFNTTDGKQAIMDVTPTELHQRVPVVLGSANEVDQIAAA